MLPYLKPLSMRIIDHPTLCESYVDGRRINNKEKQLLIRSSTMNLREVQSLGRHDTK